MNTLRLNFGISFSIGSICVISVACRPPKENPSVSVVSKDSRAIGISIRGVEINEEEIASGIKVQLVTSEERVPILGDFSQTNGDIIFEPLVPFTRGLTYEVLVRGQLLSEIKIPPGDFSPPQLLAVYPSADTLPENLLKMYFQFSTPMVEESSLSHITLVRSDGDTLKGTFLDLHPELWNRDGTVLTLWLDPGRIKRDLIPNKELGAPLKANERYTLFVNTSWQSKQGLPLQRGYSKSFVTTVRDDVSPSLSLWKIDIPSAGSSQSLVVHFEKPLDYVLSKDAITIKTNDGNTVSGSIEIDKHETVFRFIPAAPWTPGGFVLQVESRLEDLAGNNLSRPFDRDVDEQRQSSNQQQQFFTKEFEIR